LAPTARNDRLEKTNWEPAVVEGMVVVVIVGMLLAIAIPQYRQLREKRTIDRARETLEHIWEAQEEYERRYGSFNEVKGAEEIQRPMPEGLGIKLDDSLPFYFAATDQMVIALGTERMEGITITYSSRREPNWQTQRAGSR
jgi:type II secretory pathway pseudopilin PulG